MLFIKTVLQMIADLLTDESPRIATARRSIVLQLEELEPREVPAAAM